MDQFARIVLGYHGCNTEAGVEFASQLFQGSTMISQWRPSANDYDWLGHGIYFWEHGPQRAREWAGAGGTVIGAVIQLGRCFDLTDIRYTELLNSTYNSIAELYRGQNWTLPENRGRDLKMRDLDCLIINQFMNVMDNDLIGGGEMAFGYQTVRCPFEEGAEAFPGSLLKKQTHIQLSVRDPNCILGVFRPNV